MPRRCAFGCESTEYPVHHFPSRDKFPERFKAWVTLCGGKLKTESDYVQYALKVACDRHFTASDHNRNKRLNCSAVPSLYLNGTSRNVTVNIETERSTQNLVAQSSDTQDCTLGISQRVTVNVKTKAAAQNSLPQWSSPQPCTLVTQKHERLVNAIINEHSYTVASKKKRIKPREEGTTTVGTYKASSTSFAVLKTKNKNLKRKMEDDLMQLAANSLTQKPDEYQNWALSCAEDLKKMEPIQQILAKKAIADIIMEGQLGLLHRNSVKINSPIVTLTSTQTNNSSTPLPQYHLRYSQQQNSQLPPDSMRDIEQYLHEQF